MLCCAALYNTQLGLSMGHLYRALSLSDSVKTGSTEDMNKLWESLANFPLSHKLVFKYLILKDVQNITMF